jgi:DNA modification methylase
MKHKLVYSKNISRNDIIWKYSNPIIAQNKSYKYLGKKNGKIFRSTKKNKKYMVIDPKNGKYTHFGQIGYEDYTKHKDKTRRKNYLNRASHMRGHWKNNKYSANNLSIHVLW